MKDEEKSKAELLTELARLRRRIQSLEATQAAHKEMEQILQQRNRELMLLNRASQVFISTHDLDQVLTTVLEEVRQSLGVVACSAWLVDPATIDPRLGTGELVCRQVTDPQGGIVRGWRLPPGEGLAGWVAQHGQSLIVGDTRRDTRHFKAIDEQTGLVLRSILTVPLRVKDKVIGVIQVVDETVNRFTTADMRLLESLATVAAIAIENARLHEQTRHDAETKATLLNEVNHRIKNNLTAIIGLLYAELNHHQLKNQPTCQTVVKNMINRIQGLATAHSLLSAAEWQALLLSDLIKRVIYVAADILPPHKHLAIEVLENSPAPIKITPKQASSLALVINELTTNTIKHALAGQDSGQINVSATLNNNQITLRFSDNGPGYPAGVLEQADYNVGLYLINNIIRRDLRGAVNFNNNNGAVATIQFRANHHRP